MNTSISNGDSATPGNIAASRLVPEADRMNTVDKLFGLQYVLKLEPLVFQFAEHLAENYEYGYWAFYCLDSGGFYMAPLGNASGTDTIYSVSCPNGFDGQMTADALGVVACLYAYSHLSFGEGDFAETCADHYHWLREYAMDHAEVSSILRAID